MAHRLTFAPVPNLSNTWYVTDTRDGDAHLGLIKASVAGWTILNERGPVRLFPTREAAGQVLADRADAHFAALGIALPV